MSSFIRPFVDQENSSNLLFASQPRNSLIARGPVGKSFQSGIQEQVIRTPARRALGDLNTGGQPSVNLNLNSKVANAILNHLKPAASASKPLKTRSTDKSRSQQKHEVKVAMKQVKSRQFEDRENMHLPIEEEDDFEDIWPSAERPATYTKEMRFQWRTARYFSTEDDNSGLDESFTLDTSMEETHNTRQGYHVLAGDDSVCDDSVCVELECEDVPLDIDLPQLSQLICSRPT